MYNELKVHIRVDGILISRKIRCWHKLGEKKLYRRCVNRHSIPINADHDMRP